MPQADAEGLSWQESRLKRFQVSAISGVGYPIIRLLGATYRWRAEGTGHYDAVLRAGRQPIMAFWHGRILPATVYFQRRGIVIITSANFDGEWIARIIERFGYGTARGSSSRGGAKALVQLKRLMADGKPAGFTLDGPRGPARIAQPGAVFLARITGNPIVPFHIEAARHWTARSWDRTQVPKPGSTVALAVGEPFYVPPDLDDEGLERHRVELQSRLASLEARAFSLIRATAPGTGER
jgi:lysophospholipid acyltransferase (LPLAT)-like uncharacterized protein